MVGSQPNSHMGVLVGIMCSCRLQNSPNLVAVGLSVEYETRHPIGLSHCVGPTLDQMGKTPTDPIHKCHNAPVPYPIRHHSQQKCTHFCVNGALLDKEQVHCGICEMGQLHVIASVRPTRTRNAHYFCIWRHTFGTNKFHESAESEISKYFEPEEYIPWERLTFHRSLFKHRETVNEFYNSITTESQVL